MSPNFEETVVKEMTKDITPKSVLLMMAAVVGMTAIDLDKVENEAVAKACLENCNRMCCCVLAYMENNGFQLQKTEKRIQKLFNLTYEEFQKGMREEIDKMLATIPMLNGNSPTQ